VERESEKKERKKERKEKKKREKVRERRTSLIAALTLSRRRRLVSLSLSPRIQKGKHPKPLSLSLFLLPS